jgi:hypothetical protein
VKPHADAAETPDTWRELFESLVPLTKAPREYAGRFTVVDGGRPVIHELRPGDEDRIPPEVSWEIAGRAADYEFHTHPAAYGTPAEYPSAEDLAEAMSKLAMGFRGSAIVTPAGVIRIAAAATPETPLEHAQRRLYTALAGAGPVTFSAMAAIASGCGLRVEYVSGAPPAAPLVYDANDAWLSGLDAHIEALAR